MPQPRRYELTDPTASSIVALTGFGQFPGVEENHSQHLARQLAETLNAHSENSLDTDFVAKFVPLSVDWATIAQQVNTLYKTYKPDLVIHFGVCRSLSQSVTIERTATNCCALEPDAQGCRPVSSKRQPTAPARLTTTLPVDKITASIGDRKLQVSISDDAGQYLCNAAYYHSLANAAEQEPASAALFVHIPANIGPASQDWSALTATALSIITTSLAFVPQPASS